MKGLVYYSTTTTTTTTTTTMSMVAAAAAVEATAAAATLPRPQKYEGTQHLSLFHYFSPVLLNLSRQIWNTCNTPDLPF
jgi:hypothetical protein